MITRTPVAWVSPTLCRLFVLSCYACAVGSFTYSLVHNGSSLTATRWLVLRAVFGTYALAFASLAWQIRGLVGGRGILPIATSVRYWKMRTYDDAPMLLRLRMRFQIWLWDGRSDGFLLAMAWAPVLVAIAGAVALDGTVRSERFLHDWLGLPQYLTRLLEPACMWVLFTMYASLRMVAGEFAQLQWDSLILEVSLYCTVLATVPAHNQFATLCLVHALRFVMFKLWVSSGVVKIMSGDASWKSLRAMHYHYLTQPLPNPLAWYMHGMPDLVHYMEVVFTFAGELLIPYCLFFGASARLLCFWTHAALLLGIAITGNYGFFQVLCASADIAYLDDKQLFGWVTDAAKFGPDSPMQSALANYYAPLTLGLVWLLNGEPLANLSRLRIQPYGVISRLNTSLAALHACGSYGLFAVMTTRRVEVILEGSADGHTWHEFELPWKPGNVRRAPAIVPLGHMPRLDWRLWFLPLRRGSPPQWFISLLERLLEGSPHIYALFSHAGPFHPTKPPSMVRARLFEYGFAKPRWFSGGTYARIPDRRGDWWVRREVGMYYGIVDKDAAGD